MTNSAIAHDRTSALGAVHEYLDHVKAGPLACSIASAPSPDSGFSRWMVPPAALVRAPVHRPGLRVQRVQPADDQADRHHAIGARTTGSSPISAGSSASRSSSSGSRPRCSAAGSRKAARAARCSPPRSAGRGGFLVSAFGVYVHKIWLIYLGYGVLGGIGLGIGYISPVSTLIRWFPDRPGMATGMAIMGFGGGAFIASPLSVWLMQHFSTPTHIGVAETFIVLGIDLFLLHDGRRGDRAPAAARLGAGRLRRRRPSRSKLITTQQRVRLSGAEDAAVLADLVGAVPERHRRHRRARPGLGDEPGDVPGPVTVDRGGRLRRADEPVQHGRPLLLGVGVRLSSAARTPTSCSSRSASCSTALVPHTGAIGSVALFVLCFCVIISMYGGGFATVPAYLRDMFGTRYVGAIHGLLLTAWSMAGIFGPVLVNYIRAI